jgi:hypothetical protein
MVEEVADELIVGDGANDAQLGGVVTTQHGESLDAAVRMWLQCLMWASPGIDRVCLKIGDLRESEVELLMNACRNPDAFVDGASE